MYQDLKLSNYYYDLPVELIALRPAWERDHSKLLVYDKKTDEVIHSNFLSLAQFIPEYSTFVLNNSKVCSFRLRGKKDTGAAVEILLLGTEETKGCYKALLKTNGKKSIGHIINLPSGFKAIIHAREQNIFFLRFNAPVEEILNFCGEIPLPPYIRKGQSDDKDRVDYQTIFAKHIGSAAAPTAGLHFTERVFKTLKEKYIEKAYITLHIGPGTFNSVQTEWITSHNMHREKYFVDQDNMAKIEKAKKVFAIGTTSLRVLESMVARGGCKSNVLQSTNIFLYPGKKIRSIHGLITNFHLPYSTLLMLVSALVGRERALELYREAILQKYRFYSYGDAMLILL